MNILDFFGALFFKSIHLIMDILNLSGALLSESIELIKKDLILSLEIILFALCLLSFFKEIFQYSDPLFQGELLILHKKARCTSLIQLVLIF